MGVKERRRCYVLTCYDTTCFTLWKKLDLDQTKIRWFSFQFEVTPKTHRDHIQGYVEFHDAVSLRQAKKRLRCNTVNLQPRAGTRVQARDYSLKEDTPEFRTRYPQWTSKGYRKKDTEPVTLGTWKTEQGVRNDLVKVAEMIQDGSSETEIFFACPREYLKFSGHIRRALNLITRKSLNQYIPNLKVKVYWGATRSGKNKAIFEEYGASNCFIPTWNGKKFWFDGYEGQKTLVIQEFTGQCPLSVFQKLTDVYRQQVEVKGDMVTSNWDNIVITSNISPNLWWDSFVCHTPEQEDSIIERITSVKFFERPQNKKRKTWTDLEVVRLVLPSPLPYPLGAINFLRNRKCEVEGEVIDSVENVPSGGNRS